MDALLIDMNRRPAGSRRWLRLVMTRFIGPHWGRLTLQSASRKTLQSTEYTQMTSR